VPPKKPVPEKKAPPVVAKKPEPPPEKGIFITTSFYSQMSVFKILYSFALLDFHMALKVQT
jgi:hypothetical protein